MSNISHKKGYGKKAAMSGAVGGGWGLILLIISASTSFLFYSKYVGDIFDFAPAVSWLMAGAIGVILGEGGIVAWSYLRLNSAETGMQIGIAYAGFIISLVASASTTFVFIILALTQTLLKETIDSASIANLSLFGGVLIALMMVIQLALFSFYGQSSAQAAMKIAQANLRAMQFENEMQIEYETAHATQEETLQQVRKRLPENSQRQAEENADQIDSEKFNYGNGKGNKKFRQMGGLGNPATAHDESDRPM